MTRFWPMRCECSICRPASRSPAEMPRFLIHASLHIPLLHFAAQNMDVMAIARTGTWLEHIPGMAEVWAKTKPVLEDFMELTYHPALQTYTWERNQSLFDRYSNNVTNFRHWICTKINKWLLKWTYHNWQLRVNADLQNNHPLSTVVVVVVWSLSRVQLLWLHGLEPAGLLPPWNSPGKNTGVGCHFLLQGILLTQELNSGLLHCRQILYRLSYEGSPHKF